MFDAKGYARVYNLTKTMIRLALGGLVPVYRSICSDGRNRRTRPKIWQTWSRTRRDPHTETSARYSGEQEETHVLIVYHLIITFVFVILVSSRDFLFFEFNLFFSIS